jgi:2-iminobutanoate/2-iminopropanoate deaminase
MTEGIEAQTRQVLKNLEAVIHSQGGDLSSVLKTTVFLSDMNNFSAMNEIYKDFFPQDPPARSTVEVAALPKGALVEIECIARV